MDCPTIQRWFSPYLDGLLAASERATLEAHVTACARCRGDLESLKQMLGSLHAMETAETPDLLPGIRAKLTRPPWWERAAARFVAPWPESLPWHGLALAGSAALIAIMVMIPEYRLKVKAPASEDLRFQLSQVQSQARQYGGYRDADRADVPELSGGRLRAQSDVLERESKKELRALSVPAATIRPLEVQWHVANLAAAVSRVCEWVRARQGGCAEIDEQHLAISLLSSEVPQFLQQFSTPPEEAEAASPLPITAPVSAVVAISLELVPSE